MTGRCDSVATPRGGGDTATVHRARFGAVSRRTFCAGAAALATLPTGVRAQDGPPFGFHVVIAEARALAAAPHAPRAQTLRPPFDDLGYSRYGAIRLREDRRIWHGEGRGFVGDLLPPGFLFRDAMTVATVDGAAVREIPFDIAALSFDPSHFNPEATIPAEAADGHAWTGVRLRHALNRPGVLDEVVVFHGASYFRAVARDLIYGLSARGLAIGTGSAKVEEFPVFAKIWLVAPRPGARKVTVHALLDSPSVAGAYAFEISPGRRTVMDVRSVLFPRADLAEAGIAPLTSMHWFSAMDRRRAYDHRAAVHDSDGLAMLTGAGERIWRPLSNPAALQVSTFADEGPRGFGLAQRERRFEAYLDVEARYDLRPSVWIEPRGNWGAGAVTLVEIPTKNEFHDNIVSFWRPQVPLAAGVAHQFDYRLTWAATQPETAPLAEVVRSRAGVSVNDPERRTIAIDFDLKAQWIEDLTVEAGADRGEIADVRLIPLPAPGRARVALDFAPPSDGAAELRLRLVTAEGAAASETWLWRWTEA